MTISDSRCLMENGASCLPCTPEEEKSIIADLKNKAEAYLEEGSLYYVISSRWFNRWAQYVGQGNDYTLDDHVRDSEDMDVTSSLVANRPGPIDNSDIVLKENRGQNDELELLRTLQEGHDYILVPEVVWLKLFDWYNGGPVLPRKLISHGLHKDFNVEVYPLRLKLIDSRDGSESLIRLSRQASVKDLYERVFVLKGLKAEDVRIWDYFNRQRNFILVISNQTLEASNLLMDQDILLEVQQNGSWLAGSSADSTGNVLALVPMEPLRSSITIAGGPALSNGYSMGSVATFCLEGTLDLPHADAEGDVISTGTDKRGLAGLQNLGNTCFMNSAVQCLVHTPPLLEYFLHDFTEEINKHNPLGMHGELAIAFGELLRKLWSSGQTAIVPRAFKGKLSRFAPQFSGYNQHDAQELLAFLLDGLHEDLNRVKKKPYIEINDSDGLFDEEVAEECWKNHKARNDSIIVDVCQGQYKSTLVCPVCQKVSVTFDPFMYLSLPLPSTATRDMTVTVLYGDGSGLPMPYTVSVVKHGCCKHLCEALGAACCLSSGENLLLAEVFEHRICRYMDNPAEPLSSIKDDDYIVAYRLRKKLGEQILVEMLHQHMNNGKFGEGKLLGTPLVTDIEVLHSVDDVHQVVATILLPLKKEHLASYKDTNIMVNGYGSKVDGLIDNFNPQVGLGSRLSSSSESDEVCCRNMPFKLSIIDEMGWRYIPLEEVSVVRSDKIVQIMIGWTDTMHEFYDCSYLEDLPEVCKLGFTMKKTRQEAISLFSCLDAFLKEEPLGPDDMWYCPSCKQHRQATKKLDLWRLPDILVFHLKRFSYSRYVKNKLDTFVNFPIHDLDLSKYVKNKRFSSKSHVYKLYAVSNHYGGLGGGHYSAYAKLVDEDRWYHLDDSHVSPVGEAEIKTAAAYVLFYQKGEMMNTSSLEE